MSAEAKRVKILTLVALLLGLVLIIGGIVLNVSGYHNAGPSVLAGEGVLTLFFGVRGALIANVPARMGKLVKLAAIVLVLQLVLVAGIVFLVGPEDVSNDVALIAASVVPSVLTLVVLVLSRGITKRAER